MEGLPSGYRPNVGVCLINDDNMVSRKGIKKKNTIFVAVMGKKCVLDLVLVLVLVFVQFLSDLIMGGWFSVCFVVSCHQNAIFLSCLIRNNEGMERFHVIFI